MLAIIQEIGVIQSVIIAWCLGFLLGMLAIIICEAILNTRRNKRISKHNMLVMSRAHENKL